MKRPGQISPACLAELRGPNIGSAYLIGCSWRGGVGTSSASGGNSIWPWTLKPFFTGRCAKECSCLTESTLWRCRGRRHGRCTGHRGLASKICGAGYRGLRRQHRWPLVQALARFERLYHQGGARSLGRRLHRWSSAAARGGWRILRALGCGDVDFGKAREYIIIEILAEI